MKIHTQRLNTLRNDDSWDTEVVDQIESIAKEILNTNTDILRRTDEQGRGKSKAVQILLEPNEIYASSNHRLLHENHEFISEISDIDSIHVIGLYTAIAEHQNPEEKLPGELVEARRNSPLKMMREDHSDYGKEYIKANYDNPVTQYLSDMWSEVKEGDKAVYATIDMLPVISQIMRDEKGNLFVDEGIERETDINQMDLTFSQILQPFHKPNINTQQFQDNIDSIDFNDYNMDIQQAWDKWKKLAMFLLNHQKRSYEISDLNYLTQINLSEYDNWNDVSELVHFYRQLRKPQVEEGYISEWQKEKYHQINEGNHSMVIWMNQLEETMDFLLHFYDSNGLNVMIDEEDGKRFLESRKLKMNNVLPFIEDDTTVTILDAESSNWMETWDMGFDMEKQGVKTPPNKNIYKVKPRKNKSTLTRKHVKGSQFNGWQPAEFVKDMVETVNQIHHKSDKKVGAVGYKTMSSMLDCPFLYYGDSEGNNDLKDVDILFVFGSPRVGDKQLVKWHHDLHGEFPATEPLAMKVDGSNGKTGFQEPSVDDLWNAQVDRKVRDAIGRGRTADIVFKIGYGGDKAEYDNEISMGEMYSKIGVETRFDILPVTPRQTKYGYRKGWDAKMILYDNKVEGTTEELQKWLKDKGVEKSKSSLKQTLTRFTLYKLTPDGWKLV